MKNKQQANSETKKPSNQPSYGDKPWQAPDTQDEEQGESCGCDGGKGNKKDKPQRDS